VLPHLDAAYNLARWLLKDDQSARDVVQEAYLRAFRFFDGFRGGDARPWVLGIVRNSCYTWLHDLGCDAEFLEFDEERDSQEQVAGFDRADKNPERLLEDKYERDEGCAEADWLRLNLSLWRLTGQDRYLDAAEAAYRRAYCSTSALRREA